MNSINIKKTRINKNRIDYDYEISGEWSKYFNEKEKLFIEYSIDISTVPESIAVIPLLGNILPIAWLCDATIELQVVDKAFYESIPEFKKGYEEMHKSMRFKGNIKPLEIVDNSSADANGCLALFSGGVDAFNTLVNHVEEQPTLVTLWGSDVKLDDEIGWDKVRNHIDSVSREFNLDKVIVRTNFRTFINEGELEQMVIHSGDGWWHGYQHGLGIITHTAPIAYSLCKSTVYIASTFTIADKGISCASDPTIDNFVRFSSTKVVHDGYEYARQMKIHNISEFSKHTGHKIRLHVCWKSRGGENCCYCEKCLRTIVGLYANGDNPQNFGFDYPDFSELCRHFSNNRWYIVQSIHARWAPIQKSLKSNYKYKEVEPHLRWFYKADLNNFNPYPLGMRIKNKIRRILSKIIKK